MSYYLRLLIILASIITLFYVLRKIRKAQIQIADSLFWIFLSLVFVIMGTFPQVVYALTRLMGFQAPVNLIFLVMIFILLLKVFLSSIKISQLENKLDSFVQEMAIESALQKEKEEKERADKKAEQSDLSR